MFGEKWDRLAPLMRALILEDGDATALASRFVTLLMVGSWQGLALRLDDRGRGIAEMARRAAVDGGALGPDEPMPDPIVFDYPKTDLICGVAMARGQCMAFCHAEDDQQGVVVLTDGSTAQRYRFSAPHYSEEPPDVPGIEAVH